jgi:hypothetical protein
LAERAKLNAAFLELLQLSQRIERRPERPVERTDDEDIAAGELAHDVLIDRAMPAHRRDAVLDKDLVARPAQLIDLAVNQLVIGRGPDIAKPLHDAALRASMIPASQRRQKRTFLSGWAAAASFRSCSAANPRQSPLFPLVIPIIPSEFPR